jgi:hypothetical protein
VTPTTEILIANPDGQQLLIRALSRSHPGLFDHGDGNWIDCEIDVHAGAFHGSFRADLRTEEFHAFLEQLEGMRRTAEGTASFSTMEGQLAFTVTGDASSVLRLTGEAIDAAGIGNRLQFAFDLDRLALADVCRSLETLLAAFPVVGLSTCRRALRASQ